jgi:hypothetical protein
MISKDNLMIRHSNIADFENYILFDLCNLKQGPNLMCNIRK